MVKVAILQSSYLPWKGYFDLIAHCDEFIFLDNVQFTKRDWRSRNRIKTANGLQWLTVPVATKGLYTQRISEAVISDPSWARRHLSAITGNYAKADAAGEVMPLVGAWLNAVAQERQLSRVNRSLIEAISGYLKLAARFRWAWEILPLDQMDAMDPTERLVELCRAVGADVYYNGPAGRSYMKVDLFERAGVELRWFDVEGYPEYPQLHGPFEHKVSVIDLLLNTGTEARRHLKGTRHG